jgi:malonyl-CoA O-methyltransferase
LNHCLLQPENRSTRIVSPAEGHRIWSESYDSQPNPLLALEFRYLSRMVQEIEGRLALDVACGTGRWLGHLVTRGARAFGIDASREMLLNASKKPGLRERLMRGDLCHLPCPDGWADLVLCAFSLGYIRTLEQGLGELARLAKAGGAVIVSDFHPEGHARGWKRAFRSGAHSYEIEHYPYTIERLLEAARNAGLDLEELQQPALGEPERRIFQEVGKETLFEEARGVPAVLIARWKRR